MATPQVQNLDQIYAELGSAYDQSQKLVQQQQSALPQKYDAQRSGLVAEKAQGFNTINTNASARGRAYGGLASHEQADYLSTKFLPGMQMADRQQNEEQMALSQSLAGIVKERRLKAQDIRGQQQSAYEQYMEAERQRAFQAEQARQEREFQAAQAAAQRAASGGGGGAAGPSTREVFAASLAQSTGKDGKVAPGTFTSLRNQYVSAGYGSAEDFNNQFGQFINQTHQKRWGGYL